jgi:hypothetical protein
MEDRNWQGIELVTESANCHAVVHIWPSRCDATSRVYTTGPSCRTLLPILNQQQCRSFTQRWVRAPQSWSVTAVPNVTADIDAQRSLLSINKLRKKPSNLIRVVKTTSCADGNILLARSWHLSHWQIWKGNFSNLKIEEVSKVGVRSICIEIYTEIIRKELPM